MLKLRIIAIPIVLLLGGVSVFAFRAKTTPIENTITVFHSKSCDCCSKWLSYLKNNGFSVKANPVEDMTGIKVKYGVPGSVSSCHTAIVGKYVLEGHVPVQAINKLLSEKPDIRGIAVPGMPMGSPGMESLENERYDVVSFKDGQSRKFMTFTGAVAH